MSCEERCCVICLVKFIGPEAGAPKFIFLRTIRVLARNSVEMVESATRLTRPETMEACLAVHEGVGRSSDTLGALRTGLLESKTAGAAECVLGVLNSFLALGASSWRRHDLEFGGRQFEPPYSIELFFNLEIREE